MAVVCAAMGLMGSGAAFADRSKTLTLFHTNDLHSHFRAEKEIRNLGGLARLKTLLDAERKKVDGSLTFDGGDFSEGSLYYFRNFGVDSLRAMQLLGYDAVVLGNHDWLNGPDVLWNVLREARIDTPLLSANLSWEKIPQDLKDHSLLLPWTIKTVHWNDGTQLRVGVIGLSTYEWIYDRFFAPIEIKSLNATLDRVLPEVQAQSDLVIVLSHNGLSVDRQLLERYPAIAGIISAHDHERTDRPIVVERPGGNGFLVETGSWGRELGRLQLSVNLSTHQYSIASFDLLPVRPDIPEDPLMRRLIESVEQAVTQQFGPIFDQVVGVTPYPIDHAQGDSLAANLVADSLREATHTDLSLEYANFIYGKMDRGTLTRSDVLNMMPGILDAKTGKTWTAHIAPISGRVLTGLLSVFFSHPAILKSQGLFSTSGMEVIFSPVFTTFSNFSSLSELFALPSPVLKQVRIGGQELDPRRIYNVSMSGGMLETFKFVNRLVPGLIPLDQVRDTGQETWKLVADSLGRRSQALPGRLLTAESITQGDRLRIQGSDLALYLREVQFSRAQDGYLVTGKVRNVGTQSYNGPAVKLVWEFPVEHRKLEMGGFSNLGAGGEWQFSGILPVQGLPSPEFGAVPVYADLVNAADTIKANNRFSDWWPSR